jgi:hypothetical protein
MKAQNAFLIRASIEGKSWETKGTALTANSEAEAIVKATNILKLTPEHKVIAEAVTVYDTGAKLESNDYPYGRLKSTAFFSVDYNNNKGARTTFQTVCPKSGRLNKPKHSTYYRVILPMQKSSGHFDYCGYLDFNGTDAINKGLHFMSDFCELFTIEQIKSIAVDLIGMSQVNTKAMVIYAGSNFEDLKPLITDSIKTLSKIANTGENLFLSCLLDEAAIEATKKPNYNPFTVKSVTVGA